MRAYQSTDKLGIICAEPLHGLVDELSIAPDTRRLKEGVIRVKRHGIYHQTKLNTPNLVLMTFVKLLYLCAYAPITAVR